jgi:hypothetical protein
MMPMFESFGWLASCENGDSEFLTVPCSTAVRTLQYICTATAAVATCTVGPIQGRRRVQLYTCTRVYAPKVGRNYIWVGRKCIYTCTRVRVSSYIRIYNHILQLYNSRSSTVRCVGTSLCNILRQCERRSQDPTEFLCCLTFQQDASLNWVSPPFWHLRNWEKVQFRVFIYRSSQNWFLSHVSEPEVALHAASCQNESAVRGAARTDGHSDSREGLHGCSPGARHSQIDRSAAGWD